MALAVVGMLFPVPECAAQDESAIELHVWGLNMGSPRVGWMAVLEAFESHHPRIKIVLGPADRGSDLQKLLCGVIGNAPPDVFKREANLLGDIAARDILMPLDDFVEMDRAREDGLHESDYAPGIWDSGKGANGKLYAIPEGTNALFLAYNKDVFREVGLDPDRPPADWVEWREYAKRLTARGVGGRIQRLGNMLHAPYKEDDLPFYIAQLGGKVLSDDGRQCLLDGAEALQAMRFIAEMAACTGGRRAFDDFAQAQEGMGTWPLGEGDIAMSVEGHWVIYEAMRRGAALDLGMAPVPAPPGRPAITTSARHGVYLIPRNARHPKEAWEFIRFAAGPEGRMIYTQALADDHTQMAEERAQKLEGRAEDARQRGDGARANGLMNEAKRSRTQKGQTYPGFQAHLVAQRLLAEKFAPRDAILGRAYNECDRLLHEIDFVPVPNSPVYAAISDECRRAVDRVLYGEMTAEKALVDADRRVQEELDRYFRNDALPLFQWGYVWVAAACVLLASVGGFWWRSRAEKATGTLQRAENRAGLLFIAPWAFGFTVLIAGPMLFSLAMSFCTYDVIHPARFAGLSNYSFLVSKDPLFWKSLGNTAFMVLALPLGMAVSLGIALLLNANVKGMALYRTVFYLPAVTPAIATAVLWYALLNPDGLINTGLRSVGLDPPSWLGDKNWSKPAIVLMGLWGAGGGMILWLAGLQGIPKQLYEAASIDGAGPIRRFFSVTLPMLTPYLFFAFVTGTIGVFQIFAQALVLTKGGPADSTLFYVYYLFNSAFRYFKMGYASAQAWILFAIVLVLTLIQWRMSKKWVHYE